MMGSTWVASLLRMLKGMHKREKEIRVDNSWVTSVAMGVGRGGQGGKPPWIFKISAKEVVFQFRGVKNKFHHFWPPLEKFWKNSLVAPPGKNPSDAHVCGLFVYQLIA